MENKKAVKKLKEISKDYQETDLTRRVAEIILKETEGYPVIQFMKEILEHGLQSGVVGLMIYYQNTHKFYDNNYKDIEDLGYNLAEQGLEIKPDSNRDLKNFYAWLAFEETTCQLLTNKLGIEF